MLLRQRDCRGFVSLFVVSLHELSTIWIVFHESYFLFDAVYFDKKQEEIKGFPINQRRTLLMFWHLLMSMQKNLNFLILEEAWIPWLPFSFTYSSTFEQYEIFSSENAVTKVSYNAIRHRPHVSRFSERSAMCTTWAWFIDHNSYGLNIVLNQAVTAQIILLLSFFNSKSVV